MARPRSPNVLSRLQAAALRVFARQGLKHTRMSDIAKEMGVAQGSLYNYVESKDALFFWLVDRGLDPGDTQDPGAFPVRTPKPEALLRRVREQIGQAFALPHLDAALKRPRAKDVGAELTGIVEELYARTLATRLQAAALERSALDVPELFTLFFIHVRRGLLTRLSQYIDQRIRTGQFAQIPDPMVAARFVLETITFFGRHRFSDPDLPSGDEEIVKRTMVQLIVRSLTGPAPRARRPSVKRSR